MDIDFGMVMFGWVLTTGVLVYSHIQQASKIQMLEIKLQSLRVKTGYYKNW